MADGILMALHLGGLKATAAGRGRRRVHSIVFQAARAGGH